MTTPHLVLFDADHIRDYVFTTGRLKEIRGASEQVRRLTDYDATYQAPTFTQFELQPWQQDADEGVIYANGGAGAVLFTTLEKAKAFCEELERAFRTQTASASLSAVWEAVPYSKFASRVEAESEAQNRAAKKLARHKGSRPQNELIPSGGVLRFCASDRLRPASSRIREVEGVLFASESTANKRYYNSQYRKRDKVIEGFFWQAFRSALVEQGVPEDGLNEWDDSIQTSQDLGSLSAYARPKGYVALVYVDGDGVGKQLREAVKQQGFSGYQQFSRALSAAATTATARALANAYGSHAPHTISDPDDRKTKHRFLPFEVITIGGDDIILLCTGEHGLAIAADICAQFQAEMVRTYYQQEQQAAIPPFSASAGVVIAHDSVPIVQLERRGRELLKSAKQHEGGGVDFHIISTPGLAAIRTVRKESYQFGTTELTNRPYSHADMQELLRSARYLCGLGASDGAPRSTLDEHERSSLVALPTSKRADLYRACYGERVQATFAVLNTQIRLRPRERDALKEVLLNLGYGPAYPFRIEETRDESTYRTALIDLLEVMEFIAEEGQWASARSK
jgi:hypothetical protein